MSANLEAKKVLVEEIKENFKNSKSVVFADYRGITVSEDTALRKSMRENGVTYKVYKNRLMLRALEELGYTVDAKNLEGTTSVAFGSDEVAPAKIICGAIKDYKKMDVKFGMLDGEVIDKAKVEALSKVPSREVLISMLLNVLQGPVSGLARALNAIAEKGNN